MLGLPKSTEINKPLPKKAVFDKFKPTPTDRKLFDEQISQMAIVAEISPQTVRIAASGDVSAIYVILVTLKGPECNKRNILLLSKLIDQRIVFALQYEDMICLAVSRMDRVLMSETKPIDSCKLTLSGLNLGVVWENIIAEIGDIDLNCGKNLDEIIDANERREKLMKQIDMLEKKARAEKQPKKKYELVQHIKVMQIELGDF